MFELNISTGSTDTVTCNTGRTGPDTATICSTGTVTSAFLGLSIFICVFYLRGSTDAGLQEKQLFTKLGSQLTKIYRLNFSFQAKCQQHCFGSSASIIITSPWK